MSTPLCTVDGCGRPVPDQAYACTGCGTRLSVDLARIAALADELPAAIARQGRQGHTGGRKAVEPLPYDPTASDTARHVHSALISWARRIADTRGWPLAATTGSDQDTALATWLATHVEWIRHWEHANQITGDLHDAASMLERAVDRPPDKWYAGPCGAPTTNGMCGAELHAHPGASTVRCRECGTDWDVRIRRDWLLDSAIDVLAHASLISEALSSLDQPVKVDRIYKWVERGRLATHGKDTRGRPLYRVGDVLDLLADAQATAQRRRETTAARRQAG